MKKTKTKIVALAGPKGVGKGFVANQLVQKFGATILSYADPIRDALKALGVSFTCDKHADQPPFGRSARYMAQTLGTEWGRGLISPSIWLDIMDQRINSTDGLVIIDDARFDNEARQIKRLGGLVIELHGESVYADEDSHSSEDGINPSLVDHYLYNSRLSSDNALTEISRIWAIKN